MHKPHCVSRRTGTALVAILTLLLLAACGDPVEVQEGPVNADPVDIESVSAVEGDLVPRFEPSESDFYRMPWPSDARLHADGSVDLSDLPHADNQFVAKYIDAVRAVHGFSNLPVVYIPFTQADDLDADALPSPQETLTADADVQLIDVSEDGCGARTPLEVIFDAEGGRFIDAKTLKVAPLPGWVLRPDTPYALIVRTHFGAPNQSTARTQAFADVLNDEGNASALNDTLKPLRRCLGDTGLSAEDIAVATVFHTQDPVAETRAMREVVWRDDTPLKEITDWSVDDGVSTADRIVYIGHAPFPIFQTGEPPYSTQGGLEFDATGMPVIQRWESVPFLLAVPTEHSGALNLLLWESGTGAVLGDSLNQRHWERAMANGFAIATFVPQFHKFRGDRQFDPSLNSFNFLNPVAGRTGFRQQAAESSYFIRLLEEKIIKQPDLPTINTERIFYGGHSQGSLVGSLIAGTEPRIDTYVFSGVSAYLTETILSRKDPLDFADVLGQIIRDSAPLDRFHPIVQMAQLGADAVDTQNYAPHWAGWPGHPGGSNVLIINGQHDYTTSVLGMNALMTAGGIEPVGRPGWDIDPYGLRNIESDPTPVQDNQTAFNGDPVTTGAYLHPGTGHFTLFDRLDPNVAAVNFWTSSAEGKAVIDF